MPSGVNPPIRISALGRFDIDLDGAPLRFAFKLPRKPLALLKTLLCATGSAVHLDAVCAALWPDLDGRSAARALHTTTFRLRGLLRRSEAIILGGGLIALDPQLCRVDAWAFEQAWGAATEPDAMRSALRHYAGPLLPEAGHGIILEARERLRRKFFRGVIVVGHHFEHAGDWQGAIDFYQSALDADAASEDVHRALMQCQTQLQKPAEVATTYQRCRAMLMRQFGTTPAPATEELYRRVCLERAIPSAAPAPATLPMPYRLLQESQPPAARIPRSGHGEQGAASAASPYLEQTELVPLS